MNIIQSEKHGGILAVPGSYVITLIFLWTIKYEKIFLFSLLGTAFSIMNISFHFDCCLTEFDFKKNGKLITKEMQSCEALRKTHYFVLGFSYYTFIYHLYKRCAGDDE